MRRWVILVALLAGHMPCAARAASPVGAPVASCLQSAASAYRLPPAVLLILLSVEGGALGHISANSNGTVDIGPMQVNSIWIPVIARRWNATSSATYAALRDSFCANIEAGTWILRQAIDQAHGDFWEGVGRYHSHDPCYQADYLRKVLRQTIRLQAGVRPTSARG